MKPLAEHLLEFKTDGLTIFPAMLEAAWVAQTRAAFDQIADRIPTPDGDRPSVITDVHEHRPELVLPAISNPRLLDFAELLVGPHVQLESSTYRREPPHEPADDAQAADGAVLGYHRDMFAFYPEDGVYHRPLLFNALTYLQDLTDETGPLRVVPGSHMRAIGVTADETKRAHPDEVLVYPKAGDVLVFHCSVLHSGSANRSPDYRYLFFITLNHSWLKHRANFRGPATQAAIASARARGDRRLLRLLGVDDQFAQRANSGFREPDEVSWQRWIAEDRAAIEDAAPN